MDIREQDNEKVMGNFEHRRTRLALLSALCDVWEPRHRFILGGCVGNDLPERSSFRWSGISDGTAKIYDVGEYAKYGQIRVAVEVEDELRHYGVPVSRPVETRWELVYSRDAPDVDDMSLQKGLGALDDSVLTEALGRDMWRVRLSTDAADAEIVIRRDNPIGSIIYQGCRQFITEFVDAVRDASCRPGLQINWGGVRGKFGLLHPEHTRFSAVSALGWFASQGQRSEAFEEIMSFARSLDFDCSPARLWEHIEGDVVARRYGATSESLPDWSKVSA